MTKTLLLLIGIVSLTLTANAGSTILVGRLFTSHAQAADDLIDGCQGEGCGCTDQKKSNKGFELYEKMDLKSKILGKFKAGTEATAGKATTKILNKGKSKVTEVKESALGLKKGDEVNTVFYLGEGFMKLKRGDKWIEYSEDDITLKEIEAFKYENWLEVTVGKLHGYTPTFPFMGCLE